MNCLLDPAAAPAITDREFALFRELIHAKTGIALKDSKRALVSSRLLRRLRELGLESFTAYHRYLETRDPAGEELRRMINCMTTNKTSFFREAEHFAILAGHLRAGLHAGRTSFRLWSAACSTGEEPYSMAITALEVLHAAPGLELRILASDIDTDVLAQAEEGVYALESLAELDGQRKRRYFLRGHGAWQGLAQVKPDVRGLVEFRHINLIEEPWPVHAKFDAIFCRNVAIYFDREVQQRLFQRLVARLAGDGLLFVGHSETLHWMGGLLASSGHSVYHMREGT